MPAGLAGRRGEAMTKRDDVIDVEWQDVSAPIGRAPSGASVNRRRQIERWRKHIPRQVVEIAVGYAGVLVLAACLGPPGALFDLATHALALGAGAFVAVLAWTPGA